MYSRVWVALAIGSYASLGMACGGGAGGVPDAASVGPVDGALVDATTVPGRTEAGVPDSAVAPPFDTGVAEAGALDGASGDGGSDPWENSEDCTKSSVPCIAASGTVDGRPVVCRSAPTVQAISLPPPRWAVACYDDRTPYAFGVQFPVQAPGPIEAHFTTPVEDGAYQFYARGTSPDPSLGQGSTNLISADLMGVLGEDNVATGTLIARFARPVANCDANELAAPCGEGAYRITFRVEL